jgi:proteasome lid subunit RPN8/RPN11
MNMSKFTIKCSDQMMKKIEDHCFSETQIEVGGFLVGYLEGDTAHVTNVFPAKHSVGASTQLTFTHDSWNAIYEQLEKEPEGSSLIGWFHSHPNFGVFLSDHDKFIQANFFKQDGQITVVVDPIRGKRGWFFSSAGKIETYKEVIPTDRKRLGVSDSNADQNIEAMLGGGGKGVSLPKVIAISGIMSLVSFVAGWTLTTGASTDKASQSTVNQLVSEVENIKQVLIENNIGVAQVPTKPTPAPKPTKAATTPPKVTTATPKAATTTPKATTTAAAKVIKKGAACTSGDKDPAGKLLCQKAADNKFKWVETLSSKNPVSASPIASTSASKAASATPTVSAPSEDK